MVPVKLHLRNFMCYRGSENLIDFTGIHLACLAGNNGQGKSALLDAMTWALWGKARTNSADALITYGETEMDVIFEFDLSDTRLRVIRKRSSAGRGSSGLELQGRTKSGFYASLSEGTMRDTQRRINELLRLDYETFVNSAFLLQGRADEFTIKRPSERKQILADILGLAQYDQYAEEAKKQAREADVRRQHAEVELKRIEESVQQIQAFQEEVVNAEVEANAFAKQVREAMQLLQQLFDQRRELDAKVEARTLAERRIQEVRGEMAKLAVRLEKHRQRIEYLDLLLARQNEIEAAMAELGQARADKERWEELLRQSLQLQNESNLLQGRINQARTQLEGEQKSVESQIQTYQNTLKRMSLESRQLSEAQKQVELLERLQEQRAEQQRLLVQWTEAKGKLQAENNQLKEAMHELKERMNLLAGTHEATCPVCRRPLSADARADSLQDAENEGKRMGDRYRENRSEMQRVSWEINSLHQAITSADRQLPELGRWQQQAAKATQATSEIRYAQQELQRSEEEVLVLRARLEAGDYAREEQRDLALLGTQNDSLGYDRSQHEAAQHTIRRLAPRQQEFNELVTAHEQRANLIEVVNALEESSLLWRERVATIEQELSQLAQELQQRSALLHRVEEQQVTVNNLQRDTTSAERRHGAARQKLEDAERNAAKKPEIEQLHHQAVSEHTIYRQLANAFGKRGIQAMIIESAIPDIEAEANELLGRMTNGRMNVSMVTQRDLKSGQTSETLEIFIADENGQRPYETFSGGEAFRVNFALRIALSKLLAHRAGANLRTLIMDEGFGSQDAEGRERLIEAITSIQQDFDRILVITHIDELKDAFPVRIDVVKNAQGSLVTVN